MVVYTIDFVDLVNFSTKSWLKQDLLQSTSIPRGKDWRMRRYDSKRLVILLWLIFRLRIPQASATVSSMRNKKSFCRSREDHEANPNERTVMLATNPKAHKIRQDVDIKSL